MVETRAGKYGRNLAILTNYLLNQNENQEHRKRFIRELKKYSLEPRKKGQEINSGCVYELENIEDINIKNPEDLARLIKEGIHLMYQKNTAKKVLTSLLENLKN